ncbi:MAG: hypothetical protein OEZ47_11210 [Gammaproteobacteria bacterium]|nr:hypothetical protein [Gammaproteobacteria bacterium]
MSIELFREPETHQLNITVRENLTMEDYPEISTVVTQIQPTDNCKIILDNIIKIDSAGLGMLALIREISGKNNIQIKTVSCSKQVSELINFGPVSKLFA